jgi:hypothetical protein
MSADENLAERSVSGVPGGSASSVGRGDVVRQRRALRVP